MIITPYKIALHSNHKVNMYAIDLSVKHQTKNSMKQRLIHVYYVFKLFRQKMLDVEFREY